MAINANRRDVLKLSALMAASGALAHATPETKTPANQAELPAGSANLRELVSLFDFEAEARRRMPHMEWEYVNGAAADEITMRWNREAFDRLRLNPRVLNDVSKLDTRVTLFGQELPFPILLAPTALHRLAHPQGEIATARGASETNTAMVLSTMSSIAVEDVAKATGRPLWFQLYAQNDRGFTQHLVERVQAAGCRALCVTVDTPVDGARNRQQRAHFHLPPGVEMPNLKGVVVSKVAKPQTETDVFNALLINSLTWKDIDWLLSIAKVPLLLKGVLNADDAATAAKAGVAGIIVSNHGARNLDTVPATIDALPRVADRVGDRLTVLMDGGVRRGTDIVKALALGARAVLIGRPYVYGLAAGGEQGVARVINILRNELEMAMALSGRPTLASIDRSVLWD
jgi:4-hydroxymandelate oxidase